MERVGVSENGPMWEIRPVGVKDHVTYSASAPEDLLHGERKRLSIADGWNEYERLILDPAGASQTQRSESRRVWYGAIGWVLTTMSHSMDSTEETTDTDEQYMATIHAELMEFADRIKKGIA